jgi:23S rRNA (uridine2552-2'-O)-methyltransferase
MVKKVQDYYFKKAKKEKYPARSVYKLEEAQEKYAILKKGDTVLDLGCHPGSWSLYSAKIVGASGLVVGIDLNRWDKVQQTGKAKIIALCADIMAPDTISLLAEYAGKYDVVLSDMAPRTTGNKWADQQHSLNLSRQALFLAEQLLKSGGNFYCKVFEGEDFKLFFESVAERFEFAKIVKPKSSRKESREVFILAKGYVHKRT